MKKLKVQNSNLKITTQISKFSQLNFSLIRCIVIVLTFNIWFLSLPVPVYAQLGPGPTFGPPIPGTVPVDIGAFFGFGHITSLGEGTSKLVMPIFSIATFLVILYFLLGAFRYLKAGESKEEVEAAKKMISHAIVGFIILMFAFLILQFLLSTLFKVGTFRIFS